MSVKVSCDSAIERSVCTSFDAAMLDDEITMKRHAYVAVAILEQAIQREIANDLP